MATAQRQPSSGRDTEHDVLQLIGKDQGHDLDHTHGDQAHNPPVAPPPKPDQWANPCVVGLFGFALTTMCIGLATNGDLGIDDNPGLAMALVFGGGAQFIAGLIALRKGWIFPGTVFVCYGSFWMSVFVMLLVLPKYFDMPSKENDMLIFWWMWTLVTITFTISSHKHGYGIQITFYILIVAFLLLDLKQHLAIHEIANKGFNQFIGWVIFFCGFTAWLTGTAIMTNDQYGKTLIPLCKQHFPKSVKSQLSASLYLDSCLCDLKQLCVVTGKIFS